MEERTSTVLRAVVILRRILTVSPLTFLDKRPQGLVSAHSLESCILWTYGALTKGVIHISASTSDKGCLYLNPYVMIDCNLKCLQCSFEKESCLMHLFLN